MAGKFPKNIKYQKKNFNIYKKFNEKFTKKTKTSAEKTKKLKFNDLSNNEKRKYQIEGQGGIMRKGFFDDLFDKIFGKEND